MTENEIKAALGDYDAFWLTLWAEARGEPVEGQIGVGSSIRHRVMVGTYGRGYRGVCLKPRQFSCWNPGTDANHVALMRMAERVISDHALRSTQVYDDVTRQLQFLAQGIMGGHLQSNVGRANHYLTTRLFETKPPKWARGQIPVAEKGTHVFLEL